MTAKSSGLELIKFCVVGCIVIACDGSIYWLLGFYVPIWAAKLLSFSIAGLVAYTANKYWTFQQKKGSSREFIHFIIANSLGMLINVCVNQWMLGLLDGAKLIAFSAATASSALTLFLLLKFWVFVPGRSVEQKGF